MQVSTWFANARRRLKKENKMTWEPKNKLDDDDVDVSDDDLDKDDYRGDKTGNTDMYLKTSQKMVRALVRSRLYKI